MHIYQNKQTEKQTLFSRQIGPKKGNTNTDKMTFFSCIRVNSMTLKFKELSSHLPFLLEK